MPPLVHEFDWPDRVVVGTVGQPGSRAFYLQARAGSRTSSVLLEKQQSAVLAESIGQMLDQLMAEPDNRYSIPAEAPAALVDDDPLDQPVEPEFRTGSMTLSWDPRTAQVVVELFPMEAADDDGSDEVPDDLSALTEDDDEPDEVMLVRMPVGTARAFVQRTRAVVLSGRPACPLCGEPVDDDQHVCAPPDQT